MRALLLRTPGATPTTLECLRSDTLPAPKVERFPRPDPLSVGDPMVAAALGLLLLLVQSSHVSDKARLLDAASLQANALRYLLRLARDLPLMTVDAYGFANQRVEQVGRMGVTSRSSAPTHSFQTYALPNSPPCRPVLCYNVYGAA